MKPRELLSRVVRASGWFKGRFTIAPSVLFSVLFVLVASATPPPDPLDSWHFRTPGASVRGIAFGDGLFVARGYDTNSLTSTDGVHWTRHSLGGSILTAFSAAYGNGRFVFTGHNGFGVTTNGIHWSYAQPGGFFWGWEVVFADGRFVAVGIARESPIYDSAILTSTDGLNWTQKAYYTNSILRGLAYGGGVFAAVGQVYSSPSSAPMSFTATSTDTEHWSTHITLATATPLYITFGKGIFCGSVGGIFTGTLQTTGAVPAIEWTRVVEPTRWGQVVPFDTAFFAGTFLVAGGENNSGSGFLATSTDGTNWTRREHGSSRVILTTGFGRGRFLAGGEEGISQSDSITPVPPLIIQPPADSILRVGGNYTNRVVAEGQPFALQWRVNGIDLPGATNATLIVTNATEALSGAHTVVATSLGGASTSSVARVLVAAPCSIELQPVSQSTVAGGSATFSVRALGTPPIAFRWRREGTTVAYAFQDQNTSFLTITNALSAANYTVVVSNWASYPGEISAPVRDRKSVV